MFCQSSEEEQEDIEDKTTAQIPGKIVSAFRKDLEKGSCGGTLISRNYVLTAAHCCFEDKDPRIVNPQTVLPHVLQELDVVVKPSGVCDIIVLDWESQICAAGTGPAKGPCPGDSGGPLMYYNTTGEGRYMLMGVVSAGTRCSNDDPDTNPGVYTRVSNVMPWILNNIR
ncbi:clotting factor B-like [Homalodisca vitripennis]|uniref:clotting factor B-like n=1 Tax=Homalodisca vitripennis TaxID=197043 RepID=UPI001EE9BFA6|nr:clotting factor B-like [Homalodisca vitripennis]